MDNHRKREDMIAEIVEGLPSLPGRDYRRLKYHADLKLERAKKERLVRHR